MRILTTGVDAAGHSCALHVDDLTIDPPAQEQIRVDIAYDTTALPLPPRPPARGPLLDLGVPPEHVKWTLATFPPGFEAPMHHTDTVDLATVLTGDIVLLLDDGEHAVEAGDMVVVAGVDHGWRAGSEGSTLCFLNIGTAPPELGGEEPT
jgi:quercetin dioxygenase-like cupin family protein